MLVAYIDDPNSEATWKVRDGVAAAARMVDETIEVIEYSEESATPDALMYCEHFERGVSVRLLEALVGGPPGRLLCRVERRCPSWSRMLDAPVRTIGLTGWFRIGPTAPGGPAITFTTKAPWSSWPTLRETSLLGRTSRAELMKTAPSTSAEALRFARLRRRAVPSGGDRACVAPPWVPGSLDRRSCRLRWPCLANDRRWSRIPLSRT